MAHSGRRRSAVPRALDSILMDPRRSEGQLNPTPRRRNVSAPILAALACLLIAGCDVLNQQVVAKVDGRVLTRPEFARLLRNAQGGMTLPDSLHRRMLV